MKINVQKIVLEGVVDIFRPLVAVAPDRGSTISLFQEMGWDIETLMGGDITPLTTILTALAAPLKAVEQLAAPAGVASTAGFQAFKTALLSTQALGTAARQLATLSLAGGLGSQFYTDVLQKLLAAALVSKSEKAYFFFVLAGVVVPDTVAVQQNGRYVKSGSKIPIFSFAKLLSLLKNPSQHIGSEYWPNGLATDFATAASTAKVGQKLFLRASFLLNALGIPAAPTLDTEGLPAPYTPADADLLKASMYLYKDFPLPAGNAEIGLVVGLLSAEEGGPGLYLGPEAAVNLATHVQNWLVQLQLSGQLDVLAFKQNTVEVVGGAGATGTILLQASHSAGNEQVIGNQNGTRLQLGALQAGISLGYTPTSHTVDVYASLANSVLAIHRDEGDSFLNKIIPAGGVSVTFNALVGWSSTKGLYFGGKAGLRNTIPTTGMKVANFLKITSLTTDLQLTDKLAVHVSASGEATLGPVTVTLGEVGLAMDLASAPNGGNAGPFNVSVGFKAPSGVGITVSSDLVNGGGYLFFDPANHQYAGAASLTVKAGTREINLNALGLLQTQLPGKPDAYSLLLLITAQFTPIDLGLGFTLSGLGGLVGVNRAANHEYLLGMVRQGQLKQLLFPANVMDDPAGALALVDGAFPATEGRYVIGLMAQLGWGSAANIITLDVALLVELPAPVRIVLLGVLQAVLPSAKNDKLKLRADFLGLVDFGAKKASFDATLTDSHILNFALTGDLAFRLYQGSNPLFVITAGGFHPAFQPPAGADLTGLKRLRLVLAQGGDLQLKLDSYFAVTSNTVQFGAHLDLTYKIARGFRVEGHFGFDVLFQFSPFRLLAHVEAHVAIMRGSSELLGIHLSLDVTGPGPWHIWGEASFKIWFIKIGVNVNATIGASVAEPALPTPDVHELLVKALNEPASWQVEAPTTRLPAGVVLRPADTTAGQVFLDPRGALALRQRVVPLGLKINKYGASTVVPKNGQQFELTELRVGNEHYGVRDTRREDVREFFAPDQFTKLTDAQKLSAASFQLLPNGVRIKSLDGLVAAPTATRRIIEYERHDLLSGNTGGSRRLGKDTYRQLARGSALGQAVQAALPSGRAAKAVSWEEDTYEVVSAATLDAYPPAPTGFKSQAEAEQYRQQQATAADLLVVPTYQLELS
jgi:hypothetical protein